VGRLCGLQYLPTIFLKETTVPLGKPLSRVVEKQTWSQGHECSIHVNRKWGTLKLQDVDTMLVEVPSQPINTSFVCSQSSLHEKVFANSHHIRSIK
jgi:hypothetical protein